MYYTADSEQFRMDGFFLPFGGHLSADNRWVKLASIMPWDHIEKIYLRTMNQETGRRAIPSRIAFGAIFIKESERLTDEGTVQAIQENPYMQYFIGLHGFTETAPFDSSMMVHFRKRFPVEDVSMINEYICTGKWPEDPRNVDRNDRSDDDNDNGTPPSADTEEEPEAPEGASPTKGKQNPNTSKKKQKQKQRKKNRGKLIMDATVAPADIHYPTDIDLLNSSRKHLEKAIDLLWENVPHSGHKLPYSAKKARQSYLNLSKSKRWTARKVRKAIGEQLHFIDQAMSRLEKLRAEVQDPESLFPSWLKQRLEVIPTVYAQQKQMYDNKKNSCEERIVSLSQPHVRPIYRGKRPIATEFGQKLHLSVVNGYTFIEQTSWNSFNEGCDLQASVEDYKRKFGCYPAVVLADRIYQTRTNRAYCKERGIRLSGPALGRKTKETEAKEKRLMYQDACDRNAVEGRNGNAKRRYGLNLIMSKLDETAKTEAALVITAMNADARLLRWLLRFFCFGRCLPVFQ